MKNTVNEIKPAYTHYLERKMGKLKRIARTGDKERLVSAISKIVSPAASTFVDSSGRRLPTKKARFLKTVKSPKLDVSEIMFYCECSVNKARRTKAKYDNLPTER